jgi:hypothetical protein
MPFFITSHNSSRTSAIEAYDLTISNWSQFVTDIIKLSNKTMVDWTTKKEEMLFGKKFAITQENMIVKYTSMSKMIHVNPEIKFIRCQITHDTMIDNNNNDPYSYMTMDTYTEFYLPIISSAVNKMISKGYTDSSWKWYHDELDTNHTNLTLRKSPDNKSSTAYSSNLTTLLDNQIMKMYCKAVTLREEFATDLTW